MQSRTRLAEPSEEEPASPKRARKGAADVVREPEEPDAEPEGGAALLRIQAQLSQAVSQVRDFCETSGSSIEALSNSSIEALLGNVIAGVAGGLRICLKVEVDVEDEE